MEFRIDYPQDHQRMVPVRVHDPFNLAFDVRWQIGQYGRRGFPVYDRLAVDRAAPGSGREEKPAGDVLIRTLMVAPREPG